VLDKTGSLPVSFSVQIIYRIVSYRIDLGTPGKLGSSACYDSKKSVADRQNYDV